MNIKEKWEILKSVLNYDNKPIKKIIIIILAVLFLYVTLAFLFVWFLFPVQKFAESKKGFISLIAVSFIITFLGSAICMDSKELVALIKGPERFVAYSVTVQNVCNNDTKVCKEFSLLEPMTIAETSKDVFTVYDEKRNKIGTIKKEDFVLEGSDKYKELAELKQKLEKEIKELKAKEFADLEKKVQDAFYKIDLKQFSEDGNGIYDFYINPVIWNTLPFDAKQNIFKNCVTYVSLKQKGTNPNYFKIGTKIKSSANAEVLAEYSAFKGIQVK